MRCPVHMAQKLDIKAFRFAENGNGGLYRFYIYVAIIAKIGSGKFRAFN